MKHLIFLSVLCLAFSVQAQEKPYLQYNTLTHQYRVITGYALLPVHAYESDLYSNEHNAMVVLRECFKSWRQDSIAQWRQDSIKSWKLQVENSWIKVDTGASP